MLLFSVHLDHGTVILVIISSEVKRKPSFIKFISKTLNNYGVGVKML